MIDAFSNGRCFGTRCIHYVSAYHNYGHASCDVLCDAGEDRTVDDLIDNLSLYPCDKFDDCAE